MVSRNRISFAFVLVAILLVVVPVKVNGECSCDDPNAPEKDGISGFFHKVGCGLKTGAKKVSDVAVTGYKNIKKALSDDGSNKPQYQDVDVRFGDNQENQGPVHVPLATEPTTAPLEN